MNTDIRNESILASLCGFSFRTSALGLGNLLLHLGDLAVEALQVEAQGVPVDSESQFGQFLSSKSESYTSQIMRVSVWVTPGIF